MTPLSTQLESDKIRLRKLHYTDIPLLAQYANNPTIAYNTLNLPYPYSIDDAVFFVNKAAQNWKEGTNFIFSIRLKEIDALVGAIGLHTQPLHQLAELGYWVGEPFWNNGYANEAMKLMLKFGFEELELNKIIANFYTHNIASGKIIQKNGFIQEGILVKHYKKNGVYQDIIQNRLLREEYKEMQQVY